MATYIESEKIKVYSFTIYNPEYDEIRKPKGKIPLDQAERNPYIKINSNDYKIVSVSDLTQSRRYYEFEIK